MQSEQDNTAGHSGLYDHDIYRDISGNEGQFSVPNANRNGTATDDEIVSKLAGMLRLERSSPFCLVNELARQRSAWVDRNIAENWRKAELWDKAHKLVKEQTRK